MRKILTIGLVALAAACSQEDEHPIRYEAPRAPTPLEQGAVANAELTLGGMRAPALSTEPTAGAPGLADQLALELGAYATAGLPAAGSAKLGARAATSQAFDTGGMPPECMSANPETGTVTWTNCEVETTTTDEFGNPTTLWVKINGSLTSVAGTTTWGIEEWMTMTTVEDGQATRLEAHALLDGTIAVTASRISGRAHSGVTEAMSFAGFSMRAGVDTTLDLDVAYQADPFCIVSGGLSLTQVWSERPMGVTHADAPDLGWEITWTGTGCNQYTVAPGRSS